MKARALPVLLVCVGLHSGCRRDDHPARPAADSPASEGSTPLPTLEPSPPPSRAPRKPRSFRRPRREILVGGCLGTCDSGPDALRGLLNAALRREGARAVQPYLDTSRLTHNGVPWGDRWAALFLGRNLAERKASIDKWLNRWLRWSDRIIDPSDRAFDAGDVRVVESNQRRYAIDYRHPDLRPGDGTALAATWRIVLEPRGLEWLVVAISDGGPGEE